MIDDAMCSVHWNPPVYSVYCLAAVTHSVDYWSVSIAVAGIDTLLLLQVDDWKTFSGSFYV